MAKITSCVSSCVKNW